MAASGSFLEAAAGGVGGMINDYLSCVRPWGFPVDGVEAEVHRRRLHEILTTLSGHTEGPTATPTGGGRSRARPSRG
jgi:hypothetical protein